MRTWTVPRSKLTLWTRIQNWVRGFFSILPILRLADLERMPACPTAQEDWSIVFGRAPAKITGRSLYDFVQRRARNELFEMGYEIPSIELIAQVKRDVLYGDVAYALRRWAGARAAARFRHEMRLMPGALGFGHFCRLAQVFRGELER